MAQLATTVALQLRAEELLSGWPTTIEHDETLLAGGSLGAAERPCVRLRLAKKRLLASFIEDMQSRVM
jgi:hypothetical protein